MAVPEHESDHRKQLYVVLIPTGELRELAENLQKAIQKKCGLADEHLPMLHVTLGELNLLDQECSGLENLKEVLDEVIASLAPVRLTASRFKCFPNTGQAVVLTLRANPELIELVEKLRSSLKEVAVVSGETPDPGSGHIFHITLASTIFAQTGWPDNAYEELCSMLSGLVTDSRCTAETVELWRPDPVPERAVIARFRLGEGEIEGNDLSKTRR